MTNKKSSGIIKVPNKKRKEEEDMSTEVYCPQCSNHCHIDSLQCGRGRKYFANQGVDISQEKSEKKEQGKEWFKTMMNEEKQGNGNVRELFALIAHKLHHHKKGRGAGQGKILNILSSVEQINQKELQERLEIQAGSLSEILGKLEKHEWITKEKSEEDKRSVIIKITEKGKEALHLIEEEHKNQKDIFSVLDEEEEQKLKNILEKLRAALGDEEDGEGHIVPGRCKHRRRMHGVSQEEGNGEDERGHHHAHHHGHHRHTHERPWQTKL